MAPLRRVGPWVAGAVLVVVGLVAVLMPAEAGDTYCGRVLYDTTWSDPCTSVIRGRLVLGLLLGVAGLAVLIGRVIVDADPRQRARRMVSALVLVIGLLAALVALNRLLQPTPDAWCGSVLNRHRTYEPVIERRCDELLAPYRREAIGAVVVAVASSTAGLVLWRRQSATERPIDAST